MSSSGTRRPRVLSDSIGQDGQEPWSIRLGSYGALATLAAIVVGGAVALAPILVAMLTLTGGGRGNRYSGNAQVRVEQAETLVGEDPWPGREALFA